MLRASGGLFIVFFLVAGWLGLACQVQCLLAPPAPAEAFTLPTDGEGHHHRQQPAPARHERHPSQDGQQSRCVSHQHITLRVALSFRPAPLLDGVPALAGNVDRAVTAFRNAGVLELYPPGSLAPALSEPRPVVLRI